ncbi:MAG: hypothetical protein HYV02_02950 [Deltaproteobacteria bacterium]|nr:hypothetical protein [Deltaproteobacteria bacterium]
MSFDMSAIVVGIFFGFIGFGAWRYGRRALSGRHMLLGVALMVFGYFIPNPWAACVVGGLLTLLLFWP